MPLRSAGRAIAYTLAALVGVSHEHLDFFPVAEPGSKTYGLALRKEF